MREAIPSVPLKVADIAERFDMTRQGVSRWIREGVAGERLRATRAGSAGNYLVDETDLENFLTATDREVSP